MAKKIEVDVPLLFKLWADPNVYSADLPALLGVSDTSIRRLAKTYGLPRRKPYQKALAVDLGPLPWDPTPEEIAERAKECRERHFLERRKEAEETARSKAAAWRRGDTQPRGAIHDRL